MNRLLDFVIFGMPRSGTSALARYLSATQNMHCGQEVFTLREDHSALKIPKDLLSPRSGRAETEEYTEVRSRAKRIKYWGNKTPTYFYRLNEIVDELGGCPSVVCLRGLRSIAKSYATRAASPKDNWAAGRTGLYAAGDALMLAHILAQYAHPERILVVPHRALLADWPGTVEKSAQHVAPSNEVLFRPSALQAIEKIRTRQTKREKVELHSVDERAVKRLESGGIDRVFDREEVCLLSDVQQELQKIVQACPPFPVSFIRRLAEEHPDEVPRAYFERWAHSAGRAWSQTSDEFAEFC